MATSVDVKTAELGAKAGGQRPLRRDIEGMRAIAVTLVLVLHAGIPLSGGFVGVDIFFVLSGYLMTGILVRELVQTNRISLLGFYARRAKRLLPAASTVLVFTGIATLLFVPRIRWVDIGKDILASAVYVQNWRLAAVATDYNAQGLAKSPLQHFWSLAVEEQFYFIWPVLLLAATWVVRRRRTTSAGVQQSASLTAGLTVGLVILVVPSLIWAIHLTETDPSAAYFVTTTRLWELGVGGGVAILGGSLSRPLKPWSAAVAGWVGLLVTLGSAFLITEETPFPGWVALAPTLGAALVILAGSRPNPYGPELVLGWAPMQWIGKLSYSLYLWHWPLLIIVAARVGELSVLEGSMVVVASIVPAYLSFRFVEDPIRRTKRFFQATMPTLRLGAVCTVAAVSVSAVVVGATWPPPPPPAPVVVALGGGLDSAADTGPKIGAMVLADVPRDDPNGAPTDTAESLTPDPLVAIQDNTGDECVSQFEDTEVEPCYFGATSAETTVALVGDSHALQWTAPLSRIASERGWRLALFAKQNCTFAPSVTVAYDDGVPYEECSTWAAGVQQALADIAPQMVVVSDVFRSVVVDGAAVSLDASHGLLQAAYQEAWAPLLAGGAEVVVLNDTPRPGIDVPACISEHREELTACAVPRADALQHGTPLQAAAEATDGVTYINLEDAICPTSQCAAVIGEVVVYRDSNHVTSTYATTLAPRLDPLLPIQPPPSESSEDGEGTAAAQIGALVLAEDPRDDPRGAPVDSVDSIVPDPLSAAADVAQESCIGTRDEVVARDCVLGDQDSDVEVALVGDSHAAQFIAPLSNIATSRGWRLTVLAKQSCEFATGVESTYDGEPYPECAAWNADVQEKLTALQPTMVITTEVFRPVLNGGTALSLGESQGPLEAAYAAAWAPSIAAGAKIVALKDTPLPAFDVPTCVSQHPDTLTECSFSRAEGLRSETPLEAAAVTSGATLINLDDAICPTAMCAAVIGGVLVYRDENHLSATYAATLAPRIDAQLPALS